MRKSKWKLTKKDFENARISFEQERIRPLNLRNMFIGGRYCILSAADSYTKLKILDKDFTDRGLDTPISITRNEEDVREVLAKARFPNTKIERIMKFARWWPYSELPREIISDARRGRKQEFELRNQVAEEVPGMGYKCASLFMGMCGYRNVVSVDLWILRFLRDKGYDVEVPDFETIGGARRKEFLEYETLVARRAQRYDVPAGIFQRAVWTKRSYWNREQRK